MLGNDYQSRHGQWQQRLLLTEVPHLHNALPKLAVLVSDIEVCVGVIDAKGCLTPVHVPGKQEVSRAISIYKKLMRV